MIQQANGYLSTISEHYFREPKELVESYKEKYAYLFDGKAQADVEQFNEENHTFDEYTKVRRILFDKRIQTTFFRLGIRALQ